MALLTLTKQTEKKINKASSKAPVILEDTIKHWADQPYKFPGGTKHTLNKRAYT